MRTPEYEKALEVWKAKELRAYIQGYVDCVQALYHMGLFKENERLIWKE